VSYHHNPIEPSDWSYGPDELGDECATCHGDGGYEWDDGTMRVCESCGGSGWVDHEYDTDLE
jgi:DnaJ-class molecular chaperone